MTGIRRRGSLAARLGWRLAAVMLVAILLAATAIGWRAIVTVHELDDSALQAQLRLVAGQLPTGRAAPIAMPPGVVAPFRASDGDNVFLVYDGGHLAMSSDPSVAAELAPLLGAAPAAGFFRLPASPGHARGMVGLAAPAGQWRVVVLQGREQTAVLLDSLLGNFMAGAVWLLLPIGAATVLVAVVTLRRGLRPLRHVAEVAAQVGPARPGARLPLDALPAELAPLLQTVNDALDRLEQALLAQRRFMADAAHTLRTPLAVLTARLDMLDDQPGLAAVRHDADRIGRLVGQMLRMARLEALPLDVSQPVVLRAVAVEAIAALAPLALRDGIELALLDGPPARPVRGNHAALTLAVTNLIENAVAHAPRGSAVEVDIVPPATIRVLDRGPGIPAEHRARLLGRFERGPSAMHGGAGLGLAIVSEIAAAHGGSIQIADRAGGGAAFSLTLPAEPSGPSPPPDARQSASAAALAVRG